MKLIPCVRRAASMSMLGAWALVLPLAGATPETAAPVAAAADGAAPAASADAPSLAVVNGLDSPEAVALHESLDLFAAGKDVQALKRLRDVAPVYADASDQAFVFAGRMAFAATALTDLTKLDAGQRVARLAVQELDRVEKSADFAKDLTRRKELLRQSAHVTSQLLHDDADSVRRLKQVADLDPDDGDARSTYEQARKRAIHFGAIKDGGN